MAIIPHRALKTILGLFDTNIPPQQSLLRLGSFGGLFRGQHERRQGDLHSFHAN
jgi:hypothetical protein